ncbi:MAG: cation diffusion facilitator family transporter [Acidobacteriota bacterium]
MSSESDMRASRVVQRRQLVAVISLTGTILLVEAIGGVLSGSLALLSDAGHMLTDLLALVLCLMAVSFSSLPATPKKTYGYHRLEILTALLNGTLLLLISAVLMFKAVQRALDPIPVRGGMMMTVALIGLIANLAGLMLLARGHRSLNVRGARMHLIGDALSSCGVLMAGVILWFTGWVVVDSIVAGLIAIVIVVGALRLIREAVDVLLEATPAGIGLDEVSRAIETVPGVLEVHDLHIWSITTGLHALSGHVRVSANLHESANEMLNRIKGTIRDRFGIVHTTVQIESPGYEELGDIH